MGKLNIQNRSDLQGYYVLRHSTHLSQSKRSDCSELQF